MRSPDYTRVAAQLPPLYREDAASFAQLDDYLGVLDALNHAHAQTVEELAWALGPDSALHWPPSVPLAAGPDAVREHHLTTYESLASWFAFDVPGAWPRTDEGLARRRAFVARAARLWRRRGTPAGLIDWFRLFFGVESRRQPVLVEHFAVGAGVIDDAAPFTATLFVENSPEFHALSSRVAAAEFARWYAPAHVALRICFVSATWFETVLPLFSEPDDGIEDPTPEQRASRAAERSGLLRELLCTVESEVRHANGIQVFRCIEGDEPAPYEPSHHLGVGQLPHEEI